MSAPPLDRSPTRVSATLALLAALAGVLALSVSGPAVLVGVIGTGLLALGLYRGSRAAVTLGSTGVFGGTVLAGLAGSPPELLLFVTAATVTAWDVAEFAVGLGEELGRAAETRRLELVHAGSSALVATLAAIGGVLVFRTIGRGPPLALVALLCGAVVLVVALRP